MKTFKKIYQLFPEKFKKKSILFIFLSIFASILETLGIGLIFPLIEIIINQKFSKNLFGINFNEFFSESENKEIISFIILIILVLYLFKTIFLILFNYWQIKFSQNIYKFLSIKLLKKYLFNPITFYHKKNTSVLLRNVIFETKNYGASINIILKLFAEIFITFFILGLVIYIEPKKSIIIITIIISFALLFYFLSSKKIYSLGIKKLQNIEKASKIIGESLSGIRDIKLKSVENYFYEIYKNFLNKFVKVQNYQQAIIDSPRIIFEFIVLCLVLGGLLYYMRFNNDINELLPVIGLYLVAAFRLIPAIMRILSMMQSIKGLQASVDMLNNELEYYENNKKENFKNSFNEKISLNKNIKFKNVYFSYDQKKEILKDFSFEINKSEIIGIYGKSGSGKSTLVDLLTGLLTPDKGEILIDERFKLNQNNIPEWQKKIGYVSQNVFLFDKSLRENIAFGQENDAIDDKKIWNILRKTALLDVITDLNVEVGEKGIKFSGGQVQRMGIARELYRNPELLILDEATNSLDKQTENLILESIKDLKKSTTIIIISHKESTLKVCDEIINLEKN